MMLYWGSGVHWWGWLFGAVMMLAFWGAVAWAIWYFVTHLNRDRPPERRPDDAKRILDERLARGDIDLEEYSRLRRLIGSEENPVRNGQTPAGIGDRR